ncbi:MAG: PEGA domain-containing protein [Myxococcota bacterium]|nr:PEGA domain-containing protein [Myxococcota bacterium]
MTSLVASALLLFAPLAHAEGPDQALEQKIAVWRFDALGIEPELVQRLEALFRMELDRLAKKSLPTRREMDRVVTAAEQNCTGEDKCLGAIGKKLGVDVVVTGTVGAMGPNYVLTIKAVDAKTSTSIRRIESEPLRGSPDELIEGVRVAAYRLLAPDQLHGSVQVQSDLVGASVQLDGKPIGKTPLANLGVIPKQTLGKHRLRVEASGYSPFEEEVEIRFQKVSQVVVRLLPSTEVIGTGKTQEVKREPFYTKTWFIVGVGVAAILTGAYIGYEIGKVECRVIGPDGQPGGSC